MDHCKLYQMRLYGIDRLIAYLNENFPNDTFSFTELEEFGRLYISVYKNGSDKSVRINKSDLFGHRNVFDPKGLHRLENDDLTQLSLEGDNEYFRLITELISKL